MPPIWGSLERAIRKSSSAPVAIKWVIVTLDADFHAQIAVENAAAPSVIRIRREGLRAEPLARLLCEIIRACEQDIARGALVSVTADSIRIRHLPVEK